VAEVELPNPEELHERAEDRFGRRVALVTAVYAVILAVASLGGNNAMKEMLLAQQLSSDQWAYYQAKVIREHLNRGNKSVLELQLAEPSPLRGEERAKVAAAARKFADEEQRMAADKKEIEVIARKHERERDLNRARDPYFDYGEVLLQIGIVLASVSILSRSRPVFTVSLVVAAGGALLALNGYTLWVKVPFLDVR
jgi:hypothetical protein